jgi:thiol-disulfide isomerase/thioredoxin
MKIPMLRVLLGAFAGLALATSASADHHEEKAAALPLVVKIHADWCGTCVKLNPTMAQLEEQLGGEARVVVLDVTDKDALEKSSARADALGIRAFFDEYKSKTGTVGVLRPGDPTPVAVYKGETEVAPYLAAVEKAKQGEA